MPPVEQLQERLQSEPDDVFLNFGLAMAYRSAGRTEEAIAQFDRTCSLDENYVAAYFQKAILLAQTDETAAARQTLENGIARAQAIGDTHAEGEMREYLQGLDT